MKNQFLLLQIEWKKLRRSTILLISVFAVILTAVFVFAADPNPLYGACRMVYG